MENNKGFQQSVSEEGVYNKLKNNILNCRMQPQHYQHDSEYPHQSYHQDCSYYSQQINYYHQSQQSLTSQVNDPTRYQQAQQDQQRPKYMYKYYFDRYTGELKWNLNFMFPYYYNYFKDLQKTLVELAETVNKKWTQQQKHAYITYITDVNNYIRDYIWTKQILDFNIFTTAMTQYSENNNILGAELYNNQLEYLHKKSIGYDFFQDKKKKKEDKKLLQAKKQQEQQTKPEQFVPSRQVKQKKDEEIVRTADPVINLNELLTKKWPQDKYTNIQIFRKQNANLVFIGHVDSGKSTLTGNIMRELNEVDEQQWMKNKQQAKDSHIEAWELAGIADFDPTQRLKGITIECAKLNFHYGDRRFTVFDAPGHKNYVPNMIMGACQADIAVLIISAKSGEFQAGFVRQGQTRQHAFLAKSLGVTSIVVAVTKMSTVDWSQQRFNEIKDKVRPFLMETCGYSESRFIPIDSISNINIHKPMQSSWYKGEFLLKALQKIPLPVRNIKGPLRIPIIDKFRDIGNLFIYGKIESGVIIENQTVTILPQRKEFSIKEIFNAKDERLPYAIAGQNVKLRVKGIEEDDIKRGNIVCNNLNYCLQSQQFKAVLTVIELPEQKKLISSGYDGIIHIHAVSQNIQIVKVQSKLDKENKQVPALYLLPGQTGNVVIKVDNPICLQKFEFMPNLGRFTLRDEGKTIGYGQVLKIKPARTLMKQQKEQLQIKKMTTEEKNQTN